MAGIDNTTLAFRQMLVTLDTTIRPDELSRMKMFSKDTIGARNRDKIQTCVDLFERLEERKLLSTKDLTFLKQMLYQCTDGRQDVLDIVTNFERNNFVNVMNGTHQQQGQQSVQDFQGEIKFLVNNLGRDWKFFMRSLGVPEASLEMCVDSHPRNVREQIHMAFKEWLDGGKADKKDILRALQEIQRNDLRLKIMQDFP